MRFKMKIEKTPQYYFNDTKSLIEECIKSKKTSKLQGAIIEGRAGMLRDLELLNREHYKIIADLLAKYFNFTTEDYDELLT